MVILCAAKLVATIISYSSGNAGGIFAPSLYLGAMAGGAVGMIVHRLAPLSTGDPGAYALVGMGVFFAGIIRAPMTSVFMIFELTQDYQILVPLMVANLLSFMISKHYQPKPIYHALLEQDRIFLPGPESRLRVGSARVKDVMTDDLLLVPPDALIEHVWMHLSENGSRPFLVGTKESLVGIVPPSEVEKAAKAGRGTEPISALDIRTNTSHVYPDHPIDLALEKLAQPPSVVPVLSRHGHNLLGAVTKDTVMRFLDQDTGEDA
jgi:CIC family chloride channel protein